MAGKPESEGKRSCKEAIPALVVRAAPAGNVDYVDQRVLDFVGSSLEDFLNLTWAEFLHPDDVDEVRRRWYKALEDGNHLRLAKARRT